MSGRYLLDSNIVIELLRGDQAVQARLAAQPETFVNVVVLGELYFVRRLATPPTCVDGGYVLVDDPFQRGGSSVWNVWNAVS